jgi:putative transposase
VKYRFIASHPEHPDTKWAGILKVSRSAYYAWKKTLSERDQAAKTYGEAIREIFNESSGTYGAGRVCAKLRARGLKASFYSVRDRMAELGLRSVHRRCRKQRCLTDSRKARQGDYPNLVRKLSITEPFQVLSSDITYIRTKEGFEYLCQVRDVVSGVVLAEHMSDRMQADLVLETIRQMHKRWRLPVGSIFHSDRGSQYTSGAVKDLLKRYGLTQSYSRVGKPGDNAWSESFFANLKKESVHWVCFSTREKARDAMFAYIEGFYNTRRIQRRLGYLSPMQWLNQRYAKNSVLAA